jgi:hypothetical protein
MVFNYINIIGFIPKNSWVESEKLLENDPVKLC